MKRKQDLFRVLRDFALGLPGAVEDHPWGETVVKVDKKVFVFLGSAESAEGFAFSVKLPASAAAALEREGCEPTGYGLGKSGWVTVRPGAGAGAIATAECLAWVEESYCAVATKRRVRELAERRAS